MNETKQCQQCKNILDISAFSWYGDVCNGCGAFREKEIKELVIARLEQIPDNVRISIG